MKRTLVLLLTAYPFLTYAATYKCVDAEGRVTYSQMPEHGKRCMTPKLPEVQTIPTPHSQREESAERGAKPKADSGTALEEARKTLEQARKNLAEQEALRHGDEKNYQRVLDRLKPYQDAVKQAEERVRQLEQGGN